MADAPDDFMKRTYQRFIEKGYAPHAAAALAGQAHWESGGGNPLAVGDNGTARGLFQWRLDRNKGLDTFAQARGLDPNAVDTQIDYTDWELNNTEAPAGRMLRSANDLPGATDAVLAFLRPSGYNKNSPQGSHGYTQRYNNAASIMNAPNMATALAMPPPQHVSTPNEPAMMQASDAAQTQVSPWATEALGTSPTDPKKRKPGADLAGAIGNGLKMMEAGAPQGGMAPMAPSPIYRGQAPANGLLDSVFPQRRLTNLLS